MENKTIEQQAEELNQKELNNYKVKEVARLLGQIEIEKTEHETKMKNFSEQIEYVKNMKRMYRGSSWITVDGYGICNPEVISSSSSS